MKPGVFREEYIAIILRELLRGLEYLHTEGKLHRDIKGTRRVQTSAEPFLTCPGSGERVALRGRGGQAGRFRRVGAAFGDAVGEEEYVCGDAVLDVA